ncbi:DUF386 domain-containing protein [Helicobacter aurati]|uniref:DUF386 domain-containing protein n=1 Tax=Helicobacter aurati TaxID=137778 RepID=A0A3D8J2L7_9HELI|nr:YhcH/YjgK/YiaL family protein [Helicobacter aurati]RDU71643.1 DUF386 domain-containing protein [Helicobacter aurati]
MAIIGRLHNLKSLFLGELETLYEFFVSCMDGNYTHLDFEQALRVELKNGIFAMLQTYKLKPKRKAFFETHKQYVDFQLTVKGNECFMLGDSQDFSIKTPYDEKNDVVAYYSRANAHRILSLPQNLCVFMPNDVHAGGLRHTRLQESNVCKVVAKVPVNLVRI